MGTVANLVRHRRLFALMVRQDIKVEYGKYRLGILWTVGEPLLMTLLMFVVFTYVLDRSSGLDPFIIYLMTGILPFQWLTGAIGGGPGIFDKYGGMLTFSKLPIMTWPLRVIMFGFVELLMSIPVLVLLMLITGTSLTWGVTLLPIAILAQTLLGLGFLTLGASVGVTMPDAKKFTALLTRMLFWGSPILWFGADRFGDFGKFLYLNPFYGILDLYRAAIWPDDVLTEPLNYLTSAVVIIALFAGGLVSLNRRTREIRQLG